MSPVTILGLLHRFAMETKEVGFDKSKIDLLKFVGRKASSTALVAEREWQ